MASAAFPCLNGYSSGTGRVLYGCCVSFADRLSLVRSHSIRTPPRAILTLEARRTATRFWCLSFQPQAIAVPLRSIGRPCGFAYAATFSFLTGYAGLNGQQRLDAYKYLPGNVLPWARPFLVCAPYELVMVVARPAR